MKRRDDKNTRDSQQQAEINIMRQMRADNKEWHPVDGEDAKHMKREANKRQKVAESEAKKRDKQSRHEEEKEENSKAKEGVKGNKSWGKTKGYSD